jgi:Mg2+-importing ATPase
MGEITGWSMQTDQLIGGLQSSAHGLRQDDAQEILEGTGPNQSHSRPQITQSGLFLNQFKAPIALILIFAPLRSNFDLATFELPPAWLSFLLFTKSQP